MYMAHLQDPTFIKYTLITWQIRNKIFEPRNS